MTAARRTLEEIEALAAEATPGPYSISECSGGAELMLLGGPSRKYVASVRIHQVPRHQGEWEEKKRTKTAELLQAIPDLLAIAQGQREELGKLRRYIGILHEAIPELTDEMIDNACGHAIEPRLGIEAVTYGIRTARRSGYRDG